MIWKFKVQVARRTREIIDMKNVREAGLWGQEDGATEEINLGYTEFKVVSEASEWR